MQEHKKKFEDGLKLIQQLEILMNIEIWKTIKDFPNYKISNRARVRNITSGKIVKQTVNRGYYCVHLSNTIKEYFCTVHRLVALTFIQNPFDKQCVDHIDRDKLNNDVSNLRFATTKENNQNRSKRNDNTSGISGVSFHKKAKKWEVRIKVNNKNKYGGYFEDKNDAIIKRKEMEEQYFGNFKAK